MNSKLAEIIIHHRNLRGLTQKKLAELSKLSKSYIWRIETDKKANPTLDAILKIANTLDLSLEQLVFGTPAPNETEQFLKEFNNLDDIARKGILAQMKELNRLKE